MLEDILNDYKSKADVIEWKKYNCNDLFFEYIKHENDPLAENFYAGIVCRYWGYSGRVYNQCNKHVPFEQCYDVLIDTINYVLKKRVWENPESSLYQDPTGPDKAFHIALKRERSILLSNLTAYKRKTNFNTLSIDEMQEEYDDAAEGLFNIADDSDVINREEFTLINYIKGKNSLQVILLDQVCFGEWNSLKNIITKIKNIKDDEYPYYSKYYGLDNLDYRKALLEIKKSNNKKLYSELQKILYIVRREYCID